MTLYFDVSFLPKVISDFHLNQPIILPSFFKSPSSRLEHMLHNLDTRRTLAFYVERTKVFRKSNKLFVCFHVPNKGAPSSSQSIARWIAQTISLAYQLSGKSPPEHLTAHSPEHLTAPPEHLTAHSLYPPPLPFNVTHRSLTSAVLLPGPHRPHL